MLILASFSGSPGRYVKIAYGTVIAPDVSSDILAITDEAKVQSYRLSYPTWFDLRRTVWVPYSAALFDINYQGTAIIGRLDASDLGKVGKTAIDIPPPSRSAGPSVVIMAALVIRSLLQRRYPTI